MMRIAGHGVIFLLLTILTQIGGLAWLTALAFRRRLFAFLAIYVLASLAATQIAPMTGRVPLPCDASGPLQSQSWLYCALNRHYVTPEMYELAHDLAHDLDRQYPGTITQSLDGGFPFLVGFPLLPHLSHDDGEKLDLAFYWQDGKGGYLPGRNRSPIGYWGYAEGPTDCPKRISDLRWDFDWLNARFPQHRLDPDRMRAALNWMANDPRIGKILIEPHIPDALGLSHPKIRFQGCRAARHDDHFHIQL